MAGIAGLRWILLLVGLLFLLGLALWETRRSRRAYAARSEHADAAPGDFRQFPSEPAAAAPSEPSARVAAAPPVRARYAEPTLGQLPDEPPELRAPMLLGLAGEPGISSLCEPPAEPNPPPAQLSAPTATPSASPAAPSVSAAVPSVSAVEFSSPAVEASSSPAELDAPPADPVRESAGPACAPPPPVVEWPPDGDREILSVRMVGAGEERLPGRAVRLALAACGFLHGRYRIFHQPAGDGRVLLSCASLSKPGNFDPSSMDFQRFAGLSLFTVLPGPLPAADAVERLLDTARDMAERLQAELQDDRGHRLDGACVAALRQRAYDLPTLARPTHAAASAEPAA